MPDETPGARGATGGGTGRDAALAAGGGDGGGLAAAPAAPAGNAAPQCTQNRVLASFSLPQIAHFIAHSPLSWPDEPLCLPLVESSRRSHRAANRDGGEGQLSLARRDLKPDPPTSVRGREDAGKAKVRIRQDQCPTDRHELDGAREPTTRRSRGQDAPASGIGLLASDPQVLTSTDPHFPAAEAFDSAVLPASAVAPPQSPATLASGPAASADCVARRATAMPRRGQVRRAARSGTARGCASARAKAAGEEACSARSAPRSR